MNLKLTLCGIIWAISLGSGLAEKTALAKQGLKTDFLRAIDIIDVDGEHLCLKKIEDDGKLLVETLDAMMHYVQSGGGTPLLNIDALIHSTGARGVTVFAQSAKKTKSGWSNKTYIEHDDIGFLASLKNGDTGWEIGQVAPVETVIAVELNAQLKSLLPFIRESMKGMIFDKKDLASNEVLLRKEFLPEMSALSVINESSLKFLMMVRMEDKEVIGDQNMGFPGLSVAVCIQDWNEKLLKQMLKEYESTYKKTKIGHHDIYISKNETTTFLSNTKKKSAIYFDSKNNRFYFSSSLDYLKSILNSKKRLAESKQYKKQIARTYDKGAVLAYVNPQIGSAYIDKYKYLATLLPRRPEMAPLIRLVETTSVTANKFWNTSNGYSISFKKLEKGTLIHEISPISNKHFSLYTASFIGGFFGFLEMMESKVNKKINASSSEPK